VTDTRSLDANVGVALIGCGRWGRNIARALSSLGALKVIVDFDTSGTPQFAGSLGVEFSADVGAVLRRADVTAVAIATPPSDHAQSALAALRAGKHAFVEKPLALNRADAVKVRNEAQSRSLTLMVGHLLRYHPAFVSLLEYVRQGNIGPVKYVASHRMNPGAIRSEEDALWSFAPHDFSMIRAVTGEDPIEVAAIRSCVTSPNIADVADVIMTFSDGLSARASVTWLANVKEHKLTVVGRSGAVIFTDTAAGPEKLVAYLDVVDYANTPPAFVRREPTPIPYADAEPLREEMAHFLQAIASRSEPLTNANEAIPIVGMLERAAASVMGSGSIVNDADAA
jgi:UDP-2-acetamido-3-amino-2,3-dideoxy-glucuronate N-acetyltransferase